MTRTRIGLSLTALLLVLATSTADVRADGWYFSEGFGTGTAGDDLGDSFDADFTLRAAVGRRFGRLAVEGFLTGTILSGDGVLAGTSHDLMGYGISGRYMFPLSRHLEIYLRGGAGRAQLAVRSIEVGDTQYSGRSLHYGAGIQLKGKVPVLGFLFYPLFFTKIGPKVTAALWLETDHQVTRLHHPNYRSLDSDVKAWRFGFGVGSDF